jgi:hypothetical protein
MAVPLVVAFSVRDNTRTASRRTDPSHGPPRPVVRLGHLGRLLGADTLGRLFGFDSVPETPPLPEAIEREALKDWLLGVVRQGEVRLPGA